MEWYNAFFLQPVKATTPDSRAPQIILPPIGVEEIPVNPEILATLNLERLIPVLQLCPPAYRFMSLHHLIKNLMIVTLNKKLNSDFAQIESTLLCLNNLMSNIYKGEVQEKKLLFNEETLNGIRILAEENEDEEMKHFLFALYGCLEEVVAANFFKNERYGVPPFYYIENEKNFFNVAISSLTGNPSAFQTLEDKKHTKIFLGTFLPSAARTSFEIAGFANRRIQELLKKIVHTELKKFIERSPFYADCKGMGTWVMQKTLLDYGKRMSEINTRGREFYENELEPILDILAPSYLAKLLEEGQMNTLEDESEQFSSACDSLIDRFVDYEKETGRELLLLFNHIERFESFLIWLSDNEAGRKRFLKFLSTNRTHEQKNQNYRNLFDLFIEWCDHYIKVSNSQQFIAHLNFARKSLSSSGFDSASDLQTIHSLLTGMRLLFRSNINLIHDYRDSEKICVEIKVEEGEKSAEALVQEVASSRLDTSLGPVKEGDLVLQPTPLRSGRTDFSDNVNRTEENSEEIGKISSGSGIRLHEAFMQGFESFHFNHPLAKLAFKDAFQAYKNLVAELTLPSEGFPPEYIHSHANALIRFACIMTEELVTARVLEERNPEAGDFSLIRHNIIENLPDSGEDSLNAIALKGYRLESRLRYLYTDENNEKNLLKDLLREASDNDLLREANDTENPERTNTTNTLLTAVYNFVRENLIAVGYVLKVTEIDPTINYGSIENHISTTEKKSELPSDRSAKDSAERLDVLQESMRQYLIKFPPTPVPDYGESVNHLADAMHLIDLAKIRLRRSSDPSVEYAELSAFVSLAIESFIIAVAGLPGQSLDLKQFKRKKTGHHLAELFYRYGIDQLFYRFRLKKASHREFMRESRSLLSITRYGNVSGVVKRTVNRAAVNEIRQLAIAPTFGDWAPVVKKKTRSGQRQARNALLERTGKGIDLAEDLWRLFSKLTGNSLAAT